MLPSSKRGGMPPVQHPPVHSAGMWLPAHKMPVSERTRELARRERDAWLRRLESQILEPESTFEPKPAFERAHARWSDAKLSSRTRARARG